MVDQICIAKLVITLIQIRKFNPQLGGLPERLLKVDRLDGLGEGSNCAFDFALAKLHSIKPFINVVWVLAEHHIRKQKGSLFDE